MKETNKLLADFLGLETTEFHENLYLFTEETFDLEYSKIWNPRLDWNQLMQVIEKIRNTDVCTDFNINIGCDCKIECEDYNKEFEIYVYDNYVNSTFEAVYNCCLEFVNWYNKNIKTNV
jgi:hypothetical protein